MNRREGKEGTGEGDEGEQERGKRGNRRGGRRALCNASVQSGGGGEEGGPL